MKDRLEPASSIICAFGGVDRVAAITGRDKTRVYRWMRAVDKGGTGGEIPAKPRRQLIEYATKHRIVVPDHVWIGASTATSTAA